MTVETLTVRLRAIPFAARELARAARARLRGEPERRHAALVFVRASAREGDPDSVLEALDRFARERRFLMNVGDEKGRLLEEEVRRVGPAARLLELGCYCGYSAIRMARLLGPEGRLISVDVSPTSIEVAREMVRFAGVGDRVDLRLGSSSDLIPTLTGPFDLVFLDHGKSLYRPDLERLEKHGLLREGAVVVADNVGPLFGADDYLRYVRESGRYDSRGIRSHVEYQRLPDDVEISVYRGPRAAGR